MKNNLFLILFAALILACQPQQQSETEEIAVSENDTEIPTGKFGAEISEDGAVSLIQLVNVLEAQEAFEGKIIGEIKDVCSKKGCWLTVDLPNGQSMRVTFKDYGFFVPKNSQGFPVILEGIASKKTTDVETLRHYAEDAGKTKAEIEAIVADKEEYTFEAVGVIINTAEI
jgi:hypothetical protein